MSDPSGSVAFGYDDRGRLTEKTSTISSVSYTLSRSYTPGSRVSNVTYPTGRSMVYERTNCACSVDKVYTDYNGDVVTLIDNVSYRPFGVAKALDTGAGGTVDNQFDANGRLEIGNPGQQYETSYTYDNNGNLETITSANASWWDRSYSYDALNRLTSATGEIFGTIDYTYDDVGNRLTKTEGGVTDIYSYVTGTNRIDEITGTGTIAYTYDDNGNIMGIGAGTILNYDQNSRLSSVEIDGTVTGEYTYNGLGQRIIKAANGITTVFHYDFDGNIIGESDDAGNFSKEYLYNGKMRLAMVDVATGDIYNFHNDQLGTPVLLTDDTNTVVWEAEYKPFGEAVVNANSSVVNNFRFPGQYYDQETGLHYNYHRYYDPETGRYLTPDPIGMLGGINLFAYVDENPVNWVDPDGLEIRVYSSNAFGINGLNHAFVWSTKTQTGRGMHGSFGGRNGSVGTEFSPNGIGDLNSPYFIVHDLNGLTEEQAINRLINYPNWNTGLYMFFVNDCQVELRKAFEHVGLPFPGVPNDRIDFDDNAKSLWNLIFREFDNYINSFISRRY
jgi:RHS repeat-associated protein